VRFVQLWRWQGTIDRKQYATVGCAALALKYFLDKIVAGAVFHRAWMPWSYWTPLGPQARVGQLQVDQRVFAASLLIIAIPFIWLGVTLTVQRLRDAGKPLWLVVLFFIPVMNILFFLMLCTLGSHVRELREQAMPWPETRGLDAWIPKSKVGAGFVAILATVVVGLLFAALSTQALKSYGWGCFPFWCIATTSRAVSAVASPFRLSQLACSARSFSWWPSKESFAWRWPHRSRSYSPLLVARWDTPFSRGTGGIATRPPCFPSCCCSHRRSWASNTGSGRSRKHSW